MENYRHWVSTLLHSPRSGQQVKYDRYPSVAPALLHLSHPLTTTLHLVPLAPLGFKKRVLSSTSAQSSSLASMQRRTQIDGQLESQSRRFGKACWVAQPESSRKMASSLRLRLKFQFPLPSMLRYQFPSRTDYSAVSRKLLLLHLPLLFPLSTSPPALSRQRRALLPRSPLYA